MLFGAIVGAGGSGPLSDRIGRRRLVLFIALVFIVGSLVLAFSTNIVMLIIGRAIVGLAVGGSMSTVPVYLTEMAPTELRGSLGSLNQCDYNWYFSCILSELCLCRYGCLALDVRFSCGSFINFINWCSIYA